ncbi:hypothetical protein D3C76_743240 [compost metagenome]
MRPMAILSQRTTRSFLSKEPNDNYARRAKAKARPMMGLDVELQAGRRGRHRFQALFYC